MEVKEINPAWLDESHPNFKRWKRAREVSIERGKFVSSIINQQLDTKNLSVLDLGSGEGGTSKVFSENNFVVSFDLSLTRLKRQKENVIPRRNRHSNQTRHLDPVYRERNLSLISRQISLSTNLRTKWQKSSNY